MGPLAREAVSVDHLSAVPVHRPELRAPHQPPLIVPGRARVLCRSLAAGARGRGEPGPCCPELSRGRASRRCSALRGALPAPGTQSRGGSVPPGIPAVSVAELGVVATLHLQLPCPGSRSPSCRTARPRLAFGAAERNTGSLFSGSSPVPRHPGLSPAQPALREGWTVPTSPGCSVRPLASSTPILPGVPSEQQGGVVTLIGAAVMKPSAACPVPLDVPGHITPCRPFSHAFTVFFPTLLSPSLFPPK